MGVLGVFPFLKKRKVGYTHYPTLESFVADNPAAATENPSYYLDFSACFFQFITTKISSSYGSEYQVESCANLILELIKKIPNVVVVFDGPGRSKEKWATSNKRYENNLAELDKLKGLIDRLSHENPSTISKSKWRWMEKIKKRCRIMDNEFILR